jgi:hypothetical protein
VKVADRTRRRVDAHNEAKGRLVTTLNRVANDPELARLAKLGRQRAAFEKMEADLDRRFGRESRGHYWIMEKGGAVKPASLWEWTVWFGDIENRRVAFDELGGVGYVSTICLGLDHSFGAGPPILFETMARIGTHWAEEVMRRYSTYEQALAGHAELLAEHRASVAAVNKLKGENNG